MILRDSPCDKDMIKTGTPRVFLDLRCQGVKPVDNRVIPWWLCLGEVVYRCQGGVKEVSSREEGGGHTRNTSRQT